MEIPDFAKKAMARGIDEPEALSLHHYITRGDPLGGFLSAVMSNQLVEAYSKADNHNRQHMEAYAFFLFNDAPMDCWGSPEAVQEWAHKGGLLGTA
ncbi:hypothetical protein [Thiohalorhabdus sp.]|uniref:hypothetical protein n=1 Tax=Thiohalorhabdus sp. TaxID=3094134 RepID=UPI002FC3CA72